MFLYRNFNQGYNYHILHENSWFLKIPKHKGLVSILPNTVQFR